jgi:hypothetical protein
MAPIRLEPLLASLALFGSLGTAVAAVPDFHSEVAPILRDYCSSCHNNRDQEGELNMETYALLKKGGEHHSPLPSAPGEANLLQKVIRGEKPAMPPKKEPQPSAADLAVLEAWLKAGAPGPSAPDVSILTLVTVPDLPLNVKPSRAVTTVASSPDGRLVALGRYQSVEVQEAATGKRVHQFNSLPGKVTSLHFSKNGTRLAAASGVAGVSGTATIWNLADNSSVTLEGAHGDLLYTVRWSPDASLIATGGYDSKLVLWDAASKSVVRTLSGHNGAIFDAAFSPDGTLLATASGDQTVKIWRVKDGERLDTLKEPQGEQFSVAFTPDGASVLAAGADRRIRLWKLKSRTKAEINPMQESRFAHEASINAMAVHPAGDRLVSTALDRTMKVWTLPGLQLLEVLPPQPDSVTSLGAVPNTDTLLVSRMNGTVDKISFPQPRASAPVVDATAAPHPGQAPATQTPVQIAEREPNNLPDTAQDISLPAELRGKIAQKGDVDTFRFEAKKGDSWSFEVFAEREKSSLDSRIEIRDAKGAPVPRLLLQATRSSWLTFRGKDATTSDDFRVQHYAEMEINEWLYCNGEVVKLWLYPRGPDSGFIVYPGQGMRQTYFDTTPLSHPLGQPVYTVVPLSPGTKPPANGLPLFELPFENDDDASREGGRDSVLQFTAPADASYLLRITDSRGFGDENAVYRLVCRRSQPDFSVAITSGAKPSVSPGSGREFQLKAVRRDGFDGEIRVDLTDLPPGFTASTPLVIEKGQTFATAAIYAETGLTKPTPEVAARTRLLCTALIGGREVSHASPGLGEIKVGPAAKLTAQVLTPDGKKTEPGKPVELVIHPGETIFARIRANRIDFKDRIEFGKEDSGRNLPHGVYVDNLGLNGLLVPEETTEREFSLTAAKWVPEGKRLIFFRAKGDGGQATPPVLLNIVRPRGQ